MSWSTCTASDRELNAATVELAMVGGEDGKSKPRNAKASGDARLKVVDVARMGGVALSTMSADVLTARFVEGHPATTNG